MQLKLCAYSIFVTQGTPSSNCSRCKRCPFGNVLCLALDSFESLGYLLHKKVKTDHKTPISPSETSRKLSIAGLLIRNLFNCYQSNVILIKVATIFFHVTKTATRSYNENVIYCNNWLCIVIVISFHGRDVVLSFKVDKCLKRRGM